jgi:LysR family transcriptional regulator, carnitine catabolism transcriptional activator
MNISTRQLRAFLALVETRNFTRAAAAINLSQPAYSSLIRQLEDALGVQLFDRSTRRVELTADGEAFEASARRLVDEFEVAISDMHERATRRTGRVSIALLPSLAADWLPRVLAGFRTEHPGIEFQVADVLSEPCIERVRGGQADFALAATRADTPELRAEPFCSDDFHLVCPAGHPLAALANPRPRDLAPWPFIHLSRTSSVRQYIDAATLPNTLPPVLEVEQLATVAGMVRTGLGISIVPALALYPFRTKELVVRPLQWPGLKRRIYLVRRRDRSLSVAAQGFYEWIMNRRPTVDAMGAVKRRKKA